jgi:Fe-S-cluster containining protein
MARPLRITLTVNGRPVTASAAGPPERARLDQVLPALRALDDAVIDHAVRDHETPERRVSCTKGCSACCEAQPVPVTPPEAAALARLVARLPQRRQEQVRAAFAAAVERLRETGLFDAYMRNRQDMTAEAARETTLRYFALKIACPFLVDRACSIYAERPFVCRQYLVTTPPALCDDPLNQPVAPVPMPVRFASAVLATAEATLGTPQYTVPLVLALAYAEENKDELARTFPAKTVVETALRHLPKM